MYVNIAFPLNINKTFTYLIPDKLRGVVQVGMRVLAPLGRSKREGVVVEFPETPPDVEEIKEIIDCIDDEPAFSDEILELTKWIAEYYMASHGRALKCAIPSTNATPKTTRVVILKQSIEKTNSILENFNKRAFKQRAILEFLIEKESEEPCDKLVTCRSHTEVLISEIIEAVETSQSTINSLKKKGLIRIEKREIIRESADVAQVSNVVDKPHKLNEYQSQAFEAIKRSIDNVGHAASLPEIFLLHGVTGSGKTEVYMHVIKYVLDKGKSAIMLVPEIALTPQTTERLVRRFGARVTVLHSRLSVGERYDAWRLIKKGHFNIVVGPRSAIFAPMPDLGLIVIDEEHETSYKQDRPAPRYHAREVAIKRAELANCPVILGTATPSLESYYKAKQGKYTLLDLPKRVDNIPMPPVKIIDMREELTQKNNRSIFSGDLRDAIEKRLAKKQQIILFLNRRGYSTYVFCRGCGYVERCENCSVSLTYHFNTKTMECHHCGLSRPAPPSCPKCYSPTIRYFGLGTQQVEEKVREAFTVAEIFRMDTDSTSRKNAHGEILTAFREKKIDILIGTQMIAKGLDFPNVTLVGVIIADTALNLPDFRASERAFNLLTQVSGRSGRSEAGGEVIIQTYNPDHYSIQAAQMHDYSQFYEQEIEFRESLLYPPFTNAASILLRCLNEDSLINAANALAAELQAYKKKKYPDVEIRGPVPAPLSKIKGKYRWHLLLRSKKPEDLRAMIKQSIDASPSYVTSTNIDLIVDIDPMSVL